MDILKNKMKQEIFEKKEAFFRRKEEHIPDENVRSIGLSPRNQQRALLSWRGLEFEVYEKDKRWYAYVSLILIAIIVYPVYTNSLIMAMVFILIGIIFYIQLHKEPKIIDFAITTDGIIAGNEIFEFDQLKSFWIFYAPPQKKYVSFHTTCRLVPFIHIMIDEHDPVELRSILIKYIPEVKQEPGMADVLEKFVRI